MQDLRRISQPPPIDLSSLAFRLVLRGSTVLPFSVEGIADRLNFNYWSSVKVAREKLGFPDDIDV